MYYYSPGAGSVVLGCKHNIRYPDLCENCITDPEWKLSPIAEEDITIRKFN